jgi:hypothetical protein
MNRSYSTYCVLLQDKDKVQCFEGEAEGMSLCPYSVLQLHFVFPFLSDPLAEIPFELHIVPISLVIAVSCIAGIAPANPSN